MAFNKVQPTYAWEKDKELDRLLSVGYGHSLNRITGETNPKGSIITLNDPKRLGSRLTPRQHRGFNVRTAKPTIQ